MSDRESQQASIDASEVSIPAENGSREVENDPPPLGRAEEILGGVPTWVDLAEIGPRDQTQGI